MSLPECATGSEIPWKRDFYYFPVQSSWCHGHPSLSVSVSRCIAPTKCGGSLVVCRVCLQSKFAQLMHFKSSHRPQNQNRINSHVASPHCKEVEYEINARITWYVLREQGSHYLHKNTLKLPHRSANNTTTQLSLRHRSSWHLFVANRPCHAPDDDH